MRNRERLRRIERELAAVELAARDAGMTVEREVHTLELVIVAELKAGAATCAACPGSPLADTGRIVSAVADRVQDLRHATGEAAPAFKARLRRLFDEARQLRGLTPEFAQRAAPFMRRLLADVAAREAIRLASSPQE